MIGPLSRNGFGLERFSIDGLQLSQRERDEKKKRLASILSVSERTVREWLSRMDKDAKEARDKRIFELWMACWSDTEISEVVGITSQAVGQVLKEMAEMPRLSKPDESNANHAEEGFQIPIYNVWKRQEKPARRISAHLAIS